MRVGEKERRPRSCAPHQTGTRLGEEEGAHKGHHPTSAPPRPYNDCDPAAQPSLLSSMAGLLWMWM